MRRIQPVQQRPRQRQKRESPYPSGTSLIGAGVEFFEGEAQEEAKSDEEKESDN
jgi:hypothetical protein